MAKKTKTAKKKNEMEENVETESHEAGDVEGGEDKVRKARTPRDIIFTCAAVVVLEEDVEDRKAGDQFLALDEIKVTTPTKGEVFDVAAGRQEAAELFEDRWGVAPEQMRGPYFERRGGTQIHKKRDTVSIKMRQGAKIIPDQHGSCIYKGWNWDVLKTNNPDIVWIFPTSPTEAASTKKGPTPPAKPVHPSALENLQFD